MFRKLGTPDNETWKGVEELPEYKSVFPKWKKKDLQTIIPNLDKNGIDLLEVILAYFILLIQGITMSVKSVN